MNCLKQERGKINKKKNTTTTDQELTNSNKELVLSPIQAAYEEDRCGCDQTVKPTQKLSYSAQHQSPRLGYQQTFLKNHSTMANIPSNIGSIGYPYGNNGMPLYNISSGMMNQRQNFPRENIIPISNMQYSCPCSSIPPPLPPPKDDLWDLQFCRWWGWNWVRKREEMLNQKRAEIKMKGNVSNSSVNQKRKTKKKKKQRRHDDFFTWCNRLFKKRNKKQLKTEEKKQLQNLYDTPCSSVTFNTNYCPRPTNEWECRSIKLEGDYECCCSSTGKTSLSTVLVRNKTRRQACKQRKRKHQSWIIEQTDTSSSEECCPCMSLHPHKGDSSTDESIEYLSLRMAHIKSDSEDNMEYCPCVKVKDCKKNFLKPVCCHCKAPKKGIYRGCPYKIKFISERQNKPSKQKCVVREYPVIKQHHCHDFRQRGNSPSPCRSWPVCRVPPPAKVPRLCKLSPAKHAQPIARPFPEITRRCKRKYVPEYCCPRNKEYILYCPCQSPLRKRIKKCKKEKKIYHCCCCCCCCNKIQPGQQSESAENLKMAKLKPNENLQSTTDNNMECGYADTQNNNVNNINANQNCMNNIESYESSPIQKCSQLPENCLYNMQPTLSKAVEKGLYISPLTGKMYTLHPKVFSVNEIQNRSNLPKVFDLNEKMFNFDSLQSTLADEEHKSLLNAVCEAIISSRVINKSAKKFYPHSEFLPSNDLQTNFRFASFTRHRRPKISKTHNTYKNREHYLYQQHSDELLSHNYESDRTDNTYRSNDTESVKYGNLPASQFVPLIKYPEHNKINDCLTEISRSKYEILKDNSDNLILTSRDENHSNEAAVSKDACKPKDFPIERKSTEAFKPTNIRSHKTRIPIRIGNRKLFNQKCFSSLASEQKLDIKKTPFQKEDSASLSITPMQKLNTISQPTLQKLNNYMNLPFNSPQNWITPPKFTGVSLTGLLSSVTDTKEPNNYISINNKRKINVEHFKKRKLYDIFFANDKPELCEDFPNMPLKFRSGVHPPCTSCLINHLPNCPLILQELPIANVTQAIQTQGHNVSTSVEISKTESEKEIQCVNLENRPCCTESKATATVLSYKPNHPTETGTNTAISCVREILQHADKPNDNEINQNILFTTEDQSEKELYCTNFNKETPKKLFLSVNDSATLTDTKTKDSKSGPESTCLFLQHNQQNFKFLRNQEGLKNNSEKVTSVINKISEESVSDLLSTTDLQSHGSVSETSSFLSFLQTGTQESVGNSSILTESSSPFNIKYYGSYSQKPVVDTTTSPFKIKYTKIRKGDRSEIDYYNRRKVVRKESPFSMFCVPVLTTKSGHSGGRDSVSRPERKMIVSKQLKEREKRWRY